MRRERLCSLPQGPSQPVLWPAIVDLLISSMI
jgi:hypothetical protein